MGHRVTLDAFSGLPNPQWELTEQESRLFDEVVANLEIHDVESHQPPALGYRGFEVVDQANGASARVYLDSVTRRSEGRVAQLYDRTCRLQRLLIDSLRDQVPADARLAAVIDVIETNRVDPESNR